MTHQCWLVELGIAVAIIWRQLTACNSLTSANKDFDNKKELLVTPPNRVCLFLFVAVVVVPVVSLAKALNSRVSCAFGKV